MKFKYTILILTMLLLSTSGVLAVGEVTFSDLKTNEPAILEGNPLYFLKSWSRGIKNLFTNNKITELLDDQGQLAEKSAELIKVQELLSDNRNVLTKSLEHYEEALDEFTDSLMKIKRDELKGKKMIKVVDQLMVQLRLTDDLSAVLTRKNNKELLIEIQDKIIEDIIWVGTKLDTPKNLRVRLTNLYEDEEGFVDLRVAETTKLLLKKAEGFSSSRILKLELSRFSNALMIDFRNWFNNEIGKDRKQLLEDFENLAGTVSQRLDSINSLSRYFPKIAFSVGE